MKIENRLAELGYSLPVVTPPAFSYVPVTIWGDFAFVAGQVPKADGKVLMTGKVPCDVGVEAAQAAARQCALQALAWLKAYLGDLDRIARVVKVVGYVQCEPGFHEQSRVIDGASEFLEQVFGEAGQHARVAIGVAALPLNAPVEIEFTVGLHPGAAEVKS